MDRPLDPEICLPRTRHPARARIFGAMESFPLVALVLVVLATFVGATGSGAAASGEGASLGVSAVPFRAVCAPALGVALALVLTELAASAVHSAHYTYDPERGYVMAPGVVHYDEEGFGRSVWQEGGVRRPRPWFLDEPRIVVLGDSFTEALHLDDGDVFTGRLEALLRSSGTAVQVLNLGRSTESSADYVALARVFARRFEPTWSIVEVRPVDFEDDAWTESKSHFVRRRDGTLGVERVVPPEKTGLAGVVFGARQRSAALGWAGTRFAELRAATAREPPLFVAGAARAPSPPAPDYPVEEEVDALVRAFEGRVTLLMVPAFDAATADQPEPTEGRVMRRCREIGASCVTVRERYPALAARGVSPFGFSTSWYNEGHANALGHALFAEALAAELATRAEALARRER